MALKTINYTVKVGGITPNTVQFGGTQGDHNVLSLEFTLDEALYTSLTASDKVVYRFDGYDSQGNVVRGDTATLVCDKVSFTVQEWLTRYGGKVAVYLVISAIADDKTEMELYSFPALLELKNRPEAVEKETENYESLSTLAEAAKNSAQIAAEKAAGITAQQAHSFELDEDSNLIVTKMDGSQENLGNVRGVSGVYVGPGEMPEGYNVQIDVTGDAYDFVKIVDELPAEGRSDNIYLVANSTAGDNDLFDLYIWENGAWKFITTKTVEFVLSDYIKREELTNTLVDYIENQELINKLLLYIKKTELADYIVEQGEKTVGDITWNYEKRESGKAVCLCAVEYNSVTTDIAGAVYCAQVAKGISYPISLIEEPHVIVSIDKAAPYHQWVGNVTRSDEKISWVNIYTQYDGEINGRVNIRLEGRWK